jgi:hypothetical protein
MVAAPADVTISVMRSEPARIPGKAVVRAE